MSMTFPEDRATPVYDPFFYESCDTSTLNSLLRGEISAAETYDLALEKFAAFPLSSELRMIRDDHRAAIATLRERVLTYGGVPTDTSGAWGLFTSAVTSTAKVLGTKSVIAALRRGEEVGISEYQKAANNAELSAECLALIDDELLPMCRRHIARLKHISEKAS